MFFSLINFSILPIATAVLDSLRELVLSHIFELLVQTLSPKIGSFLLVFCSGSESGQEYSIARYGNWSEIPESLLYRGAKGQHGIGLR